MNRLYFEFPKEELEIFRSLVKQLRDIRIDMEEPNLSMSLMPFQGNHFTIPKEEGNCTLVIDLSPTINSRIIEDKNRKKELDREINKVYDNITLDDIYSHLLEVEDENN